MATLILRDTYRALIEEMEALDKLKRETSLKIRDAAAHGDLKVVKELRIADEESLSRKIAVSQGFVTEICNGLVKDGYLSKISSE